MNKMQRQAGKTQKLSPEISLYLGYLQKVLPEFRACLPTESNPIAEAPHSHVHELTLTRLPLTGV